MDLKDKVALVTGGSRGIGKAICMDLAAHGTHIALTYNTKEEPALETVREIEKTGRKARHYRANLYDRAEISAVVQQIVEDFDTINILVNNAGIIGENTILLEIGEEEWDRVLNLNLKGVFLLTQCVLPYMIGNRMGKIVNISSLAGKNGGTMGVHYAASKAGLIGMTFHLARELIEHNIEVNAVAPGPVDTDLLTPEDKSRLAALSPNGRLAYPEEIAHGVRFLIENDYVNGEVLDINAGRYMD